MKDRVRSLSGLRPPNLKECWPTSSSRSLGILRPRVTFSRNGTTSSGFSGPPKDTTSSASYGATSTRSGPEGARAAAVSAGMGPILGKRGLRPSMTTVPSPYPQVLSVPGALAFSAAGGLARLPPSMTSPRIVLLVSGRTGSYSTAGGVSAAYIGATAVGALPLARFVDRHGQRRVLGPAVTVSVAALALLMVAVESGWSAPWPHLFAALSGVSMPNVGSAIRARWTYVIHERALLDTAFAVEAVNDELVFIVGPTVVTLLATT